MEERINAAQITDNKTGEVYELDFDRASIKFAEARGFKLTNVKDFSVSGTEELFYLAFRKNHPSMSRSQTDRIINRWGGALPESLLYRLIDLYNQAANSNTMQFDKDAAKNADLTVEL